MTDVDALMTCHFVIIVIDKRWQFSGWHSYCLTLPITSGGDMHEITLCQRALELIEQQAVAHGAKRITGVWLKIGAFSCVETSALSFCFDLVCRGTVAEGCKLHLEEQEAECWCESCQQYVTLLTQRVRRCPQCNSDTLQIVADDGLQIRRIEIDQE
ncbi:hydrogenase nickel incorporation protein HypA/HybF [Citrobacter farmeri]|nr:hydrogenase nickel incorporation protein HypA/HybF [Citrobacter farmeri]MCW2422576.1 hydrogenase nickel incorporation protein HypA/HybF [Citrobacter farmeri]